MAAPPLDGAFMFLGYDSQPSIPPAKIPDYFTEIASLGMRTVVIANTRNKSTGGCGNGPSSWVAGMPDSLTLILDEAAKHGIKVYVGLVLSSNACPTFQEEPNASAVAADTEASVRAFTAMFGNHAALAGWYIPDEPGLGWPSTFPYYRKVMAGIRRWSAKAVVVAPYLSGAGSAYPPATVGRMAADFMANTGIDIQAWQDSTGADATDVGWGRSSTVEDYMTAISSAIGPDHLWSDNELFNYGPLRYFDGAPYSPASVMRVNQQLWQSRPGITSKRLAWLPQFHMGSVDHHRFPEAERLLASYRALYGLSGEYVVPASYAYLTGPSPLYPDGGNELFDRRTADPRNFRHAGWVGIEGTAVVRVQLQSARRIDWIGAHVVADPGPGIRIPTTLRVRCSVDGVTFADLGAWAPPFPSRADDREYVLGNLRPLGATCAALELELSNTAWTFLSEVEIVGDATPPPVAPVPIPQPAPTPPAPGPPPPAPPPPEALPQMALNVAGAQAPSTITRYVAHESTFNVCTHRGGGSAAACRVYNDVGGSWNVGEGDSCLPFDPRPHMARGSITFTLACSTATQSSSLDVNISYR